MVADEIPLGSFPMLEILPDNPLALEHPPGSVIPEIPIEIQPQGIQPCRLLLVQDFLTTIKDSIWVIKHLPDSHRIGMAKTNIQMVIIQLDSLFVIHKISQDNNRMVFSTLVVNNNVNNNASNNAYSRSLILRQVKWCSWYPGQKHLRRGLNEWKNKISQSECLDSVKDLLEKHMQQSFKVKGGMYEVSWLKVWLCQVTQGKRPSTTA